MVASADYPQKNNQTNFFQIMDLVGVYHPIEDIIEFNTQVALMVFLLILVSFPWIVLGS